jgi:hypothetical protein
LTPLSIKEYEIDSKPDDFIDFLPKLEPSEKVGFSEGQSFGQILLPSEYEIHGSRKLKKKVRSDLVLHIAVKWGDDMLETEPRSHFQEVLDLCIQKMLFRVNEESEQRNDKIKSKTMLRKENEVQSQNKNRICLGGCGKEVTLKRKNGLLFECPCFRRNEFVRPRIYRLCKDCFAKIDICCALCKKFLKSDNQAARNC